MKKWILSLLFIAMIGGALLFNKWFPALKPVFLSPNEALTEIAENQPAETTETAETVVPPNFPLTLPPDFTISIFAKGLSGARVLAHDEAGGILVSQPSEGKVVSVIDENGDGVAEKTVTVLSGLLKPHGLATECENETCKLYVAEEDKVSVYPYDKTNRKAENPVKLFDLPKGGRHTTRTLLLYNNKLYTSIGSSCDVCHEEDEKRATILQSNRDGSDLKILAKGLRNAVFMRLHPVTGALFATEMGRDNLGDDLPPDEINIVEADKNYGWPTCYGKNIHDTVFDKNTYFRNPCMEPFETPSHIDLPAHSAPLGLAFIPEEGWPEEYWHDLLIAFHGSWNRTEPTGYKIVRYDLDNEGNLLTPEGTDFISGWLAKNGTSYGRPVDLLIQPGGILYISDDKSGVIYKAMYRPRETQPAPSKKIGGPRLSTDLETPIRSPLELEGEAPGIWYFEASFPVTLLDGNGHVIAQVPAQAQDEWMTENFVPFKVTLTFDKPLTPNGTLVLSRDNPSGLPENDQSVSIPVTFAP